MGKHDMAEPMNQALERHYKDRIDELEIKLRKTQDELSFAKAMIEQLRFQIKTDDEKVQALEKSLVEMTLLATARK